MPASPQHQPADGRQNRVLMWGYLPAASLDRAPITRPTSFPPPVGQAWSAVCGGGCGFAVAISDAGKVFTWGSATEAGEGQPVLDKQQMVEAEAFPLPDKACFVRAAAGWAHCVASTDGGDVLTWGWSECVPRDDGDAEAVRRRSPGSGDDEGKGGQVFQEEAAFEDSITAAACLVNVGMGVRIVAVAAGGRHTLALSDTCQVWGWGYGGEGQLGLGKRLPTVSRPRLVPVSGNRIIAVACGGRHSAAITDAGALFTFGWGLYGQCGQGSTDDELSPCCVSDLGGLRVTGVAAGLWHTLAMTDCGAVYAFGGNQFGQLGVGGEHAEMAPRLVEGPGLDEESVVSVDCGARHSGVLTDTGKVFCWGWNKYGQLGVGDTTDRHTPAQLDLGDGVCAKSICCGWWHTLALVVDGPA